MTDEGPGNSALGDLPGKQLTGDATPSTSDVIRERLLKNLEESAAARQSSGFAQWIKTVEGPERAVALMGEEAFVGLGDLPPERAKKIQRGVQVVGARVNVVGGMASQRHHNPVPDVDIYIEEQFRDAWTQDLREKYLWPFDPRPMNDRFFFDLHRTTIPPGLRVPYIQFSPDKPPVCVRK